MRQAGSAPASSWQALRLDYRQSFDSGDYESLRALRCCLSAPLPQIAVRDILTPGPEIVSPDGYCPLRLDSISGPQIPSLSAGIK